MRYPFLALRGDPDPTSLQESLSDPAELIAQISDIVGLASFTALIIRFFVRSGTGDPIR